MFRPFLGKSYKSPNDERLKALKGEKWTIFVSKTGLLLRGCYLQLETINYDKVFQMLYLVLIKQYPCFQRLVQ